MMLPNADHAIVDTAKITDYLLNAAHPDNSGKAEFFEALGFSPSNPLVLAAALWASMIDGELVREVASPHGRKYVVDGWLETPEGQRSRVRTVWIVDRAEEPPRLVTAYPRQERGQR